MLAAVNPEGTKWFRPLVKKKVFAKRPREERGEFYSDETSVWFECSQFRGCIITSPHTCLLYVGLYNKIASYSPPLSHNPLCGVV
jgi:hypothetical protein